MNRKLYVLVDRNGRPVPAAGPAPFDGETMREAEAEARNTVTFEPGWHMVLLTPELDRELRRGR